MAKQTARRVTTLVAWQARRIESEDGKRLGRVFDLRVRAPDGDENSPVVTQIVYGVRGLLERLGLRRASPTAVHWSRVLRVRDDIVIVRR